MKSHLVLGVLIFDVQFGHGVLNSLEGLNDIAKDDGFPLELLVPGESLGIDQFHLLQNG